MQRLRYSQKRYSEHPSHILWPKAAANSSANSCHGRISFVISHFYTFFICQICPLLLYWLYHPPTFGEILGAPRGSQPWLQSPTTPESSQATSPAISTQNAPRWSPHRFPFRIFPSFPSFTTCSIIFPWFQLETFEASHVFRQFSEFFARPASNPPGLRCSSPAASPTTRSPRDRIDRINEGFARRLDTVHRIRWRPRGGSTQKSGALETEMERWRDSELKWTQEIRDSHRFTTFQYRYYSYIHDIHYIHYTHYIHYILKTPGAMKNLQCAAWLLRVLRFWPLELTWCRVSKLVELGSENTATNIVHVHGHPTWLEFL